MADANWNNIWYWSNSLFEFGVCEQYFENSGIKVRILRKKETLMLFCIIHVFSTCVKRILLIYPQIIQSRTMNRTMDLLYLLQTFTWRIPNLIKTDFLPAVHILSSLFLVLDQITSEIISSSGRLLWSYGLNIYIYIHIKTQRNQISAGGTYSVNKTSSHNKIIHSNIWRLSVLNQQAIFSHGKKVIKTYLQPLHQSIWFMIKTNGIPMSPRYSVLTNDSLLNSDEY